MRAVLPLCLLAIAASHAISQPSPQPHADIRIDHLLIDASDVPLAVREGISGTFANVICPQDEVAIRVQRAFENQGYPFAHADPPSIALIREGHGTREVAVSIHVTAGSLYDLGDISFRQETLFTPEQLRAVFDIRGGEPISLQCIGDGLQQLRQLYASKGYIRFIAIPQLVVDEAEHRIDLVIDLDEGRSFSFGQLLLEGVDPHVGAGRSLEASWKGLQGRQYDPSLLNRWLTANAAQWPDITDPRRTGLTPHDDSETVDVKLVLP